MQWKMFARRLAPFMMSVAGLYGATDCQPNPQNTVSLIEIRADPSPRAKVLASVKPSAAMKIARLDTDGRADGPWLLVQQGSTRGWVKADRLVCRLSAEQALRAVAPLTQKILAALKNRDMVALAATVHPIQGVRFAPYAFLNARANVRFPSNAIRAALADPRIRLWGTFDGSGDPIRLSFSDYYKRFVYDRDFERAKVTFNSGPAIRGNTHDNSRELYPNAIIAEVLHEGKSPEREGSDYRILRLVFEQHLGAWYLTYVIHDQWTI